MFGWGRWLSLAILLAALLVAPSTRACSIPVFRYALEHWTPSPYEVVIFTKGDLSDAQQSIVEGLTKKPVNLEVRTVDVSADMSSEYAAIWKAQKTTQLPWVVVRYPESGEDAPLVWSGKLDSDALSGQLDSPARQELRKRLVAGQSCVWVLLESGDRASDDRLFQKLADTLKRVAATIQLPEIPADGPQLQSPLPLKVDFSILRVSRTDPREAALVKMLRVAEPELSDSDEALVIPVVGRGRAVSALAASRVNDDGVSAFAQFVCGQCSCEVKELNPGIDLLLAADWDVIFGDRAIDREEPSASRAGTSVPIPASPVAAVPPQATPVGPGAYVSVTPVSYHLRREWLIIGIVIATAAVLVSGITALRIKRRGR